MQYDEELQRLNRLRNRISMLLSAGRWRQLDGLFTSDFSCAVLSCRGFIEFQSFETMAGYMSSTSDHRFLVPQTALLEMHFDDEVSAQGTWALVCNQYDDCNGSEIYGHLYESYSKQAWGDWRVSGFRFHQHPGTSREVQSVLPFSFKEGADAEVCGAPKSLSPMLRVVH